MKTLIIARRELTSFFFSPIAYVVLGLFALGTTLIFLSFTFAPGQPASMEATFFGVVWLTIFLAPAISMRLISEEYRTGTIETLMTAPLSDTQVVLGKWLGAWLFFAVLLLPMLVFVIVLESTGQPDYGPIITGLIGLLMVGGLYLAIGTFASAATQNQIIAFIATIFVICGLTFVTFFAPRSQFLGPRMKEVMLYLNINQQFDDFSKGLIDITNFVYFVSGMALFLFLAVLLLQSKRWR